MKYVSKEGVFVTDVTELSAKSPMRSVLLDSIEFVNGRLMRFFLSNEVKGYDITAAEMLVMVTANIFANLASNMVHSKDSSIKIGAFNVLNDELFALSKKLFMMLETHNADSTNIN